MTVPLQKLTKEKNETQMEGMFDSIAEKYDMLNNLLSLGIDKYWRRKVVNILKKKNPLLILDVATGTADLAIKAANAISGAEIKGVDISEKMLEKGRIKVSKKNLSNRIELIHTSVTTLPFPDDIFDAVTIGFGVRNFNDINLSLKEIFRVLKNNGTLYILEFSKPGNFLVRKVYNFYFSQILPRVGNKFTHHNFAYNYLNTSVMEFPDGKVFNKYLTDNKFVNIYNKRLTFGITTIYIGSKPDKLK